MTTPRVWAISDLHVGNKVNRSIVESLKPATSQDWMIVAGDVDEDVSEVLRTLSSLKQRYEHVIWTPGNHEMWTIGETAESDVRGEARYRALIEGCKALGVDTPEDDYLLWTKADQPICIVPLFLLYDYTFGRRFAPTRADALALAEQAGVVCADEFLLDTTPYRDVAAWCAERVRHSRHRLEAAPPVRKVLVNHFPLLEELTLPLYHPEFAQWCGTTSTADWHRRYQVDCVVYGHLHIPRTTWHHEVRFEEVSLGHPRERATRTRKPPPFPRQILPDPHALSVVTAEC